MKVEVGSYWIYRALCIYNIMGKEIYYYTLVRDRGGIMVECPFYLPKDTVFEYWGLKWKVCEQLSDNEINCKAL